MKNLFLVLITFVFISGCSTDFEVVAPYKETMVVYGLINPNDNVQYVRVSKAFLGEGNALIMAQQADSIYFGDSLDVKMERYLNGSLLGSQTLVRVDTIPKDAGTFSYPGQVIYAYTNPVAADGSLYKIIAKNTKTNLTATSSTNIIGNFSIIHPSPTQRIDFTSAPDFYNFDLVTTGYGKVYAIEMKVRYSQIDTLTHDTLQKYFEWNLDQQVTDQSFKTLDFSFKKSEFLQLVANHITKGGNKKYVFIGIDANIIAGTEDLYTYIQVTNPSFGIVQEKPVFTNIENGVGLFTCRNTRLRFITLDPKTINYLELLYN